MSEVRVESSGWPNPVRSPHFQTIYSNASRTSVSPWDISLLLGQMSLSSSGTSSIQELVQVIFSPQQFKALATAFTNTVVAYEAQFGQINVNPGLLQPPEAFSAAITQAAAAQQPGDQRPTKP
jgi:Protein of unknown function (DUF3467)